MRASNLVNTRAVVALSHSVRAFGSVLAGRLPRAGRRARRPIGAALVCIAAAAGLLPETAGAVPLAFGETMRVRFNLPAPPDLSTGSPGNPFHIADTLAGILNVDRILGVGAPSATFTLYDGTTLLGSFSLTFSTPFTTFAFSGPTSLFTFRAGSVSDFTALDDGTIDGVLDITNTSAVLFDFSVTSLRAGHGSGPNSFIPLTPEPIIHSQKPLVVPEPQMLLLFGTGLVAAFAVSRRRSRSRPVRLVATERAPA